MCNLSYIALHRHNIFTDARYLQNASEHIRERSETGEQEDSPRTDPDQPDELGSETAIQGDHHSTRKRPICDQNERNDVRNALHRDKGPRDPGGKQEAMGHVEDD